MVRLVYKEWNFHTTEKDMIALEHSILHKLDFDLIQPSPLFFLERYLRIFGLDQERDDKIAALVANIARRMIRCLLLSSSFLKFKASSIAASAILLSVGICMSPQVTLLNLS